jgi:hypothetical protein
LDTWTGVLQLGEEAVDEDIVFGGDEFEDAVE